MYSKIDKWIVYSYDRRPNRSPGPVTSLAHRCMLANWGSSPELWRPGFLLRCHSTGVIDCPCDWTFSVALLPSLAGVPLLRGICNQPVGLSDTASPHQSNLLSANSGVVRDYYEQQKHIFLGNSRDLEVISQEPGTKACQIRYYTAGLCPMCGYYEACHCEGSYTHTRLLANACVHFCWVYL